MEQVKDIVNQIRENYDAFSKSHKKEWGNPRLLT